VLPRWKKLSSEVVFENPWWRYRRDTFELEPGKRGQYHYASTYGSAMVIPLTAQGQLTLVEQYRYLLDKVSLEFPGGGVGEHESPEQAALRELEEETGHSGELIPLGRFTPWNGVTDETCHVFIAPHVVPVPCAATPDATERFILHQLTQADLDAHIANGRIWDGMTLAAYALFRTQHESGRG